MYNGRGMTVTKDTPQAQLKQLGDAVIKREFLKSTPLNLGKFLRYVLLYLLFPGMVFGFSAGIVLTVVYCLALVGILVWGDGSDARVAIYSWLAAGLVVAVLVNIVVMRAGWRDCRRRAAYRPARAGLKHALTAPVEYAPRWHERDGFHIAETALRAPRRGIYAILVSVPDYDGRQLITGGKTGTCTVQAEGKPGETFHALVLYRLEQGLHELSWAMPAKGLPAPAMTVTQLNAVEEEEN